MTEIYSCESYSMLVDDGLKDQTSFNCSNREIRDLAAAVQKFLRNSIARMSDEEVERLSETDCLDIARIARDHHFINFPSTAYSQNDHAGLLRLVYLVRNACQIGLMR